MLGKGNLSLLLDELGRLESVVEVVFQLGQSLLDSLLVENLSLAEHLQLLLLLVHLVVLGNLLITVIEYLQEFAIKCCA